MQTVFPCFLFTTGISTPAKHASTPALFKRAGILTVAGLLVNQSSALLGPSKMLSLGSWRLPGVLQRGAIASLVAAGDSYLPLGLLPVVLVAAWYGISKQYALSPDQPFACTHATAQSRIDCATFGASHLHQPSSRFDPEGLLGSVLTAPVSVMLGSYFKRGMVAATTYLTGLRQPRATLFPVQNSGASAHSLGPLAESARGTLGAVASALAMAGLASGVLTYLTPYPTPASKALWTPVFVGQTTAISIGYWAVSDVLVALTRFEQVPFTVRKALSVLVDRIECLGRMSLEGYLISCVAQVLLQTRGESSVWAFARAGFEAIGVSRTWSGVGVSLLLSVGIMEVVRPMERRGWRIRMIGR